MNRQDALTAGSLFYLTDKPCRRGHVGPRYAKTGHCVACLKESREETARLHNTAMAARDEGTALFAYRLHPDDHAAALAFCQALDMQRGRLPQTGPAVAIPPAPRAGPLELPADIARARAQYEPTITMERK